MIILDSVYINDKNKNLTWRNRNYFFVVTVVVVLLNISLYAVHGSDLGDISVRPSWESFSVENLFQALINTYTHFNSQHVLLNMLCFFVAGLYLERKQGSLKFLLFVFIMSLFTAFATSTNYLSVSWGGFSAANYGFYGYILVEFVFMLFQKKERYLFNTIFGSIVVGLIYLAMCFNGGVKSIGFEWYPYDLLNNVAHACGFIVGLFFGIYEQVSAVIQKNKQYTEIKS